jgi:hypothetical protein
MSNGSQRWPDGAVKEGKLIWAGRSRLLLEVPEVA